MSNEQSGWAETEEIPFPCAGGGVPRRPIRASSENGEAGFALPLSHQAETPCEAPEPAIGPECRGANPEAKSEGDWSRVNGLRQLLGQDAVLIPIPRGQSWPKIKGWQNTTVDAMANPVFLATLAASNIGVLLGAPSGGLCSIIVDGEDERFLKLNPGFQNTLQSRGRRERNFWVRIRGDYPATTKLVLPGRKDEKGEPMAWGQWRATGAQTFISGTHPDGCDYKILKEASPIEIEFDSIVWPDDVELPWDFSLYEELVAKEGQPYAEVKNGVQLNQPFFVAKFAEEHLVLFEPDENQFYSYDPTTGLWLKQTVEWVKEQFSKDLKTYADSQGISYIERKRTNSLLEGLTDLLRGKVGKRGAFKRVGSVIHLRNGMLHLDITPPELRSFSPHYYSRNQCPIELVPGADCPRFKQELLATALDADDIWLLQRYCGSILIGGNRAQKVLLLPGTAGGGKSTVLEIIERIKGCENVTEMRTDQLHERFELFRFLGKTLLTGKDVPAQFLMRKGASVIKKLVGHDLITPEGKHSNGAINMRGEFDVVITCNSKLKVNLEGDADAWRRRLLIIEYEKPKPEKPIRNFADLLLAEEAPGILLWMIEGAVAHLQELAECGDFVITDKQKQRVETLLAESDSIREFVRVGIKNDHPAGVITSEELVNAYTTFCYTRNWHPSPPISAQKALPDLVKEIHGVGSSHDIKTPMGTQRGYRGLRIVSDYEP